MRKRRRNVRHKLNKETLEKLLTSGFEVDDLKKAELLPESLLCEIELPIVRETVEAYAQENPQNADRTYPWHKRHTVLPPGMQRAILVIGPQRSEK